MESSSPVTPTVRRSFTTPVSKQPSSPDPQIETLFIHSSVRIVAFTTSNILPTPRSRPGSSNGSPEGEYEVGTLSWVSRFERTIAVGALRIYRAPGSVAFLNCANALKPILPKSQCWCVDGDSKFVVQIKPPQYWRIELPNKTTEEVLKVEELKKVFEQVLRFEKTPCPFQRNFTVELPPETPIKRKPWKPVERPMVDPSSFEEERTLRTPNRSSSCSPNWGSGSSKSRSPSPLSALGEDTASVISSEPELQTEEPGTENSTFEEAEPEQIFEEQVLQDVPANVTLEPSLIESNILESTFGNYTGADDESETYSDTTEDSDLTSRNDIQTSFQPLMGEIEKDDRPQALQHCSRSITAPPVLSLITSASSSHRARSRSPLRGSTNVESNSEFSSSVESFHSVQSWHSPLAAPSPSVSGESSPSCAYPYPHEEIVLPKRTLNSRDVSEITISPETPRPWDRIATISEAESIPRSASPSPRTPTLTLDGFDKSDEEQFEVMTPPTVKPMIRHRATTSSNSRRRALSPLPPAVNLFSPPRQRSQRLRTARHLPSAIIQKTYEILLSPPSHLFHLMISIASKIAAGEWRGVLSGYGEAVHWDFEDEYGGNDLFEDDYGINVSNPYNRSKTTSSNATGGSWEVD